MVTYLTHPPASGDEAGGISCCALIFSQYKNSVKTTSFLHQKTGNRKEKNFCSSTLFNTVIYAYQEALQTESSHNEGANGYLLIPE